MPSLLRALPWWICVVLAATPCAPAAAAQPQAAPRELAIRPFRQLVVVPVTIGASPELDFVLDSGSAATTLNDVELAKALGLHTRPLGLAEGFGGARLPVLSAPDVSISAGGTPLMRVDLVVHHVEQLRAGVAGRELHGLLGTDLFARHAVEIDPARRRVVLHPPSTPTPLDTVALLPIELYRGRPLVRVELTLEGGRPTTTRLLLDTGAEASVVLVRGASRRLKAPADGPRVRVTGVGGETEGVVARLATLTLGQLTVAGLEAAFVDRDSLPTTRELRRVDGVLGNGLLRGYRTWIDLTARRLALAPLPTADDAPERTPEPAR